MEFEAIDTQTNRKVHISNVSKNREYACTVCKARLFPVMGNLNAPHFRHQSTKEHKARTSAETRLHREAKNIIKFFKLIALPDQLGAVELEDIKIEKSHTHGSNKICPDATARIGDEKLFIEFKVTHGVSERKREKLLAFNIDTIEIDLSMYVGHNTLGELDLQMAVIFEAPRTFIHRRGFHLFSRAFIGLACAWNKLHVLIKHIRPRRLVERDPESGQSFWDF